MKGSLSIRDWAGPALGVALGFIFGHVIAGYRTAAIFLLFALVVVPLVIWLSPKRPMLAWQLAIVTFAVFFRVTLNDPEVRFDLAGKWFDLVRSLLMTALVWGGLFLLSSPWGVLLFRRARESRAAGEKGVGNVKDYALVAVLIVAGGILLLIAWVMVFAPNSSAWDPPGGLLVGTLAIALWKGCDRIASALGKAHEYARSLMQAGLLFCPLMALGGHHGSGGIKGWSGAISGGMLGIESLALLIWMSLTRSRGRTTLPLK